MMPALHMRISRRLDCERNSFAAFSTEERDAKSHSRNVMFTFGKVDLI